VGKLISKDRTYIGILKLNTLVYLLKEQRL
jgi:hypothetical protein